MNHFLAVSPASLRAENLTVTEAIFSSSRSAMASSSLRFCLSSATAAALPVVSRQGDQRLSFQNPRGRANYEANS